MSASASVMGLPLSMVSSLASSVFLSLICTPKDRRLLIHSGTRH